MRERLIELISEVQYMGGLEEKLADHLLAHGVIVLPCAVGNYVEWDNGLGVKTLYQVLGYIHESNMGLRFVLEEFSPIVNHRNITRILTKEEAEKALAERAKI
jgi:hypothetical protein